MHISPFSRLDSTPQNAFHPQKWISDSHSHVERKNALIKMKFLPQPIPPSLIKPMIHPTPKNDPLPHQKPLTPEKESKNPPSSIKIL
ncbi:hypothetical protein L207DRAFT_119403 [Hyaloscypha variabilis F]|uniref:Uncharacterized protein n=1 Tax=Hyaloscypha variabilis (strain UAMH 11265 / GT02V1 / F) TaxID=1149755 RepID=A0A2J6RAT2_HYAVF|nr:hypothetical protein L207DRAFT_119403 [Hyaloscypha variabilis F]